MNKQDFDMRTKVIKEAFNDTREIKCLTPKEDRISDENIHQGGDIFTTESGEFIDLELQFEDFTPEELVKYVEFAEAMYEKHQKPISIYIICPVNINICVKECTIKSDAEFKIKVASTEINPAHVILNIIKDKIKNNLPLDSADLEILKTLPMMCKKEERNYFRTECFKIISLLN